MHVIIDGYGGDPDQLSDENVVRVILTHSISSACYANSAVSVTKPFA